MPRAPRELEDLPTEYDVECTREVWFAARRDARSLLARCGYSATGDGALTTSELSGRKPLYELSSGREVLLVRRFTHGGLARHVTGRRFLDPARPFRELALAERLRAAGIATAEVVAARSQRARLGWHLDLVTRRVDDTVDLGHLLSGVRDRARSAVLPKSARSAPSAPSAPSAMSAGSADPIALRQDRDMVRVVCAAVGLLVRRMHAARFVHADLTPNNILVNASVRNGVEPSLWVLDLDRSRFVDDLDDKTRRDNLRRLLRFVERREQRDGRVLDRGDYARFFLGYDPGGIRWKEDWRAIRARHDRASSWHRIGWFLERIFARDLDPRSASNRGRRDGPVRGGAL